MGPTKGRSDGAGWEMGTTSLTGFLYSAEMEDPLSCINGELDTGEVEIRAWGELEGVDFGISIQGSQ